MSSCTHYLTINHLIRSSSTFAANGVYGDFDFELVFEAFLISLPENTLWPFIQRTQNSAKVYQVLLLLVVLNLVSYNHSRAQAWAAELTLGMGMHSHRRLQQGGVACGQQALLSGTWVAPEWLQACRSQDRTEPKSLAGIIPSPQTPPGVVSRTSLWFALLVLWLMALHCSMDNIPPLPGHHRKMHLT